MKKLWIIIRLLAVIGAVVNGGVITHVANGAHKVAVADGFTHIAMPTKIVKAKIVVLGLEEGASAGEAASE